MQSSNDARRFLDAAAIARISPLELRARQVVEGFLSGMHRSPFFGHSVEFLQHREYVPGDDLRHLDWKIWSKTDRYYIKQYEEDTNLRATFVVDVSESMRYGRTPLNKYEYASTVAACLSYLLLRQSDSVGLMTFDADVRRIVPSRSHQAHLDALTQALDGSRPERKTDMERVLRKVAENISSRGMIVLISDLLIDREPLFRGLQMLAHRRHDVLVFHVLDDDELNFPFAGATRFEGMEAQPQLLCDPRALRDGYLAALGEYLTEVRRGCASRGIDYQLYRTSDPLSVVLSTFLYRRAAAKNAVRVRAHV
jgi:uncharacterized protein (DUF58 family)